MNILIPMAGSGSRFVQAGYSKPKPFIDVCGKTMIERVLDNLKFPAAKYILLVRREHLASEQKTLEGIREKYRATFVSVDQLTEGAACTVLLASRLINNNEPLLISNSDEIVDMDLCDFIADAGKRHLDGSILTFHADHPKWSYAHVGGNGFVDEVREKVVISPHATAGLYFFRQGRFFVTSAAEMIARHDRVNQEFYVAPTYNYAVKADLKIGIYEIIPSQMFGLGTPEDLETYRAYLKNSELVH